MDYGNDRREVKVIRRRSSSWGHRRRTEERRERGCVLRVEDKRFGNGLSFLSPKLTMQSVEWPLVRRWQKKFVNGEKGD